MSAEGRSATHHPDNLHTGLGHGVVILTALPLTPMAPIRTPSSSTMGKPPGKVINPSCGMLDGVNRFAGLG